MQDRSIDRKIVEHILSLVEGKLKEELDGSQDLGSLRVSSWFGRGGDEYHLSIARVNQRTGYEKRIAIAKADIVDVIVEMIREWASFEAELNAIRNGQ